MSRRTERLSSVIQQEIAAIIQRELADPRIPAITSVTRVKVAEDLSIADVYVTMMATPGEQSAALNALRSSAGIMRTRLTKALSTRVTPFLKFHIDENLKKELAVLDLLNKVSEERAELDRKRAAEQEPPPGGEPRQGGDDADPTPPPAAT
jgi:ribosome-binding factor A